MVNVGIADLNVVKYPDVLATYALGSCVGICLYDHKAKIAGMAHIMLPSSAESQTENDNMRRYADTGVAELIRKMCSYGAKKRRITAKIAGGAQMFSGDSDVFSVGERNVAAVKQALQSSKIPIVAEQTGLDFGRTVFFYSEDGTMEVRAVCSSLSSK